MNIERHEAFQRLIDESLTGGLPAEKKQSLNEHLDTCAACQEYLGASNRVIAGLRGFSFEVDPNLNARVLAALRRSAAQRFRAEQTSRRPWVLISGAAIVLTVGGSFFDLRFGDLIASVIDIQRIHVRQGLLAFWIVPSLCVLLLFLLLPLLLKPAFTGKKGSYDPSIF